MTKKNTQIVYMEKAIAKMSEAFICAKENGSPDAIRTIKLKHPSIEGRTVEVMHIEPTIRYIVANLAPKLLNSSWRLIRAGLKIYTENIGKKTGVSEKDIKTLIQLMHQKCWLSKTDKINSKGPLSTSSKRKKFITDYEFKLISDFITLKDRKWGKTTLLWMYAAALTGLRPVEWKTAEEITQNDKLVIKVMNAKNDKNRGIGVYRFIDISSLKQTEIDIIRQHMTFTRAFDEQGLWSEYYSGCRKSLYYANQIVFHRNKFNIQLYSARHQFSADIKVTSMSSSERSVLLGHNNTATQHKWYGQRRTGKGEQLVRNAVPSMEADVKQGYEKKQNKRNGVVIGRPLDDI